MRKEIPTLKMVIKEFSFLHCENEEPNVWLLTENYCFTFLRLKPRCQQILAVLEDCRRILFCFLVSGGWSCPYRIQSPAQTHHSIIPHSMIISFFSKYSPFPHENPIAIALKLLTHCSFSSKSQSHLITISNRQI